MPRQNSSFPRWAAVSATSSPRASVRVRGALGAEGDQPVGRRAGECPEGALDAGSHFQGISRGDSEGMLTGRSVACCSQ